MCVISVILITSWKPKSIFVTACPYLLHVKFPPKGICYYRFALNVTSYKLKSCNFVMCSAIMLANISFIMISLIFLPKINYFPLVNRKLPNKKISMRLKNIYLLLADRTFASQDRRFFAWTITFLKKFYRSRVIE